MELSGYNAPPGDAEGRMAGETSAGEVSIDDLGWFRDVLVYAKQRNATDIIVVERRPVRLGILKKCELMENRAGVVVKPSKAEILSAIVETRQRKFKDETDADPGTAIMKHIRAHGYFEYAFSVKDVGRFRMSVSSSQEGLGFAARVLPYTIPRLEDLDPYNLLAGIRSLFDFSYSYPRGLILHTGVVGSGKTTLIASELDYLSEKMNGAVYTLEDPIEQEIEGVNQTQIDTAGGLTFLSGLRTLLRQDPNVLVVGEVRDEETAQTLVQAGLSGNLAISTIHSGTAAQVFARLLHMGIEPFLLASAITGVVAQRLVRRLCRACRRPRPLASVESRIYFEEGRSPSEVFEPAGCPDCDHTGYRGRMAVFEVAVPDEALREAILNRAPTAELHRVCVAAGMTPLLQAAAGHLRSGNTSIQEIGRVIA